MEKKRIIRRSKYGAKRTTIDGVSFDSRLEARRWGVLRIQEMAGEITDLRRQVKFELAVNCYPIGYYIADFTYRKDGKLIVEDSKGVLTDVFRLKSKLMKAIHGIDILITHKK